MRTYEFTILRIGFPPKEYRLTCKNFNCSAAGYYYVLDENGQEHYFPIALTYINEINSADVL